MRNFLVLPEESKDSSREIRPASSMRRLATSGLTLKLRATDFTGLSLRLAAGQ